MASLALHAQLPGQPARRSADHLVSALSALGVDLVLGVPGGAISAVHDALIDAPDVRVLTTAHETSAVFMAAAYGRQAERPAVVLVTSGPGILNTANALASALADGLPLILIAGEVPRAHQGRQALQDGSAQGLDVRTSLRALVKDVHAVVRPEALVPTLHHAAHQAMSHPRGPIVLTVPADVLTTPTRAVTMPALLPQPLALPDLATVAELLLRSPDALILAGSGCRVGDGPTALRALAERLGAPVITTPKAKGVMPETHPLSLGVFGVGGHPSALERVQRGVQTLLVLGSSMGELATDGWSPSLVPTQHLVQVDVDGLRLGLTYPVSHALRCSVEGFVTGLLPLLPQRPPGLPGVGVQRLPRGPDRGERLHPVDAVRELQHALPADTVYAVDSGEHTFWALQHLVIDAPDSWFAMLGLGSMASGICGAMGLALAHPGRTTACLCGDGGMLMALGELATAARERIPVRWFVFNDGQLGMVQHGHQALYQRSPEFQLPAVDLVAAATALGVRAHTVREPGDLMDLADVLAQHDGPLLIDMHIDPAPSMPKGGRLSTLADQPQERP